MLRGARCLSLNKYRKKDKIVVLLIGLLLALNQVCNDLQAISCCRIVEAVAKLSYIYAKGSLVMT